MLAGYSRLAWAFSSGPLLNNVFGQVLWKRCKEAGSTIKHPLWACSEDLPNRQFNHCSDFNPLMDYIGAFPTKKACIV